MARQEKVQPEKAEQLANEVGEETKKVTEDTPKVRKHAHSGKSPTVEIEGEVYMRFAEIGKEMDCAFQQVYQRTHKEKAAMRYVKHDGILYGSVADMEKWKLEKLERINRKEQRAKEKAATDAAKAAKAEAKKAAAEASADADVEVITPDA